jgi:hypothetical protein
MAWSANIVYDDRHSLDGPIELVAEANVNLACAIIANILGMKRAESISITDKMQAISSFAFNVSLESYARIHQP